MLKIIKDVNDPMLDLIRDDPVRPEIDRAFRVGTNRFVGVLVEDRPLAMVCVNLMDHVPVTVGELGNSAKPTVAVFYTVWSYAPGSAGSLLRATVQAIREQHPNVNRFVTLSPKTEMARQFHLKNGAVVLADNAETINYEYLNL